MCIPIGLGWWDEIVAWLASKISRKYKITASRDGVK